MRTLGLLLSSVLVVGSLGFATAAPSAVGDIGTAKATTRPNIVVIMTDDQRRNTLQTMPVVRKQIRNLGARYLGVIPTSTCCPSRSSFLSGQFAHTTQVYNNYTPGSGGWPTFNSSGYELQTLATALDAVGYHTGLVGKYLNQFNQAPSDYIPPGWDVFRAISVPGAINGGGRYYNYQLVGTQPTEEFGRSPVDYSTDVLADRAVRFVRDAPAEEPLFLMFTPYAPHEPFTPAPRDKGSWKPKTAYRNPAVNEKFMGDKPPFMHHLPKVDRKWIDRAQDRTGESLRAVDKAVSRLINVLGPRINDTLLVFMSDNGMQWGEHRMVNKYKPHRWSTDVPLMMRWDGHIDPGPVPRLATNVDLTATILDAAGEAGALTTEGVSLLDDKRTAMVLEALGSGDHPPYCGVRLKNWMYVEYSNDTGSELYDYVHDPFELHNLTHDPAAAAKKSKMRTLAQTLCSPVPPGFTW